MDNTSGLPRDISAWTKTTIREGLGTPDVHEDTLYVYDIYAVEEDKDGTFESYVLANGKPFMIGRHTTFEEAVNFLDQSARLKEVGNGSESPETEEFEVPPDAEVGDDKMESEDIKKSWNNETDFREIYSFYKGRFNPGARMYSQHGVNPNIVDHGAPENPLALRILTARNKKGLQTTSVMQDQMMEALNGYPKGSPEYAALIDGFMNESSPVKTIKQVQRAQIASGAVPDPAIPVKPAQAGDRDKPAPGKEWNELAPSDRAHYRDRQARQYEADLAHYDVKTDADKPEKPPEKPRALLNSEFSQVVGNTADGFSAQPTKPPAPKVKRTSKPAEDKDSEPKKESKPKEGKADKPKDKPAKKKTTDEDRKSRIKGAKDAENEERARKYGSISGTEELSDEEYMNRAQGLANTQAEARQKQDNPFAESADPIADTKAMFKKAREDNMKDMGHPQGTNTGVPYYGMGVYRDMWRTVPMGGGKDCINTDPLSGDGTVRRSDD